MSGLELPAYDPDLDNAERRVKLCAPQGRGDKPSVVVGGCRA
jgi:hypothetical protein